MIRPLAVFAALALTLGTAAAQEAAPAAAPEIVIDPAASLNTTPKQANMLTGFYATLAVIEICAVTIEPDVTAGMDADRKRLETALGMDPAMAATAYDQVKADVEKTTPDCADGSADRRGVDAVTAIYTAPAPAAPAAPPAGTVTTQTPAQ
ncbi:hypothetical protein [Devosia sp. Root635]|uniref:hypothetical protein n=1 Tax=Devosia sp. Root635 TaxID=1736575 RepID=UPI0006F6E0CA|nr:hypothetical protein [Devosia sp. Root635]KRA47185.1 hypothetical protein ASD80_17855 [Devosia sp. Root635]